MNFRGSEGFAVSFTIGKAKYWSNLTNTFLKQISCPDLFWVALFTAAISSFFSKTCLVNRDNPNSSLCLWLSSAIVNHTAIRVTRCKMRIMTLHRQYPYIEDILWPSTAGPLILKTTASINLWLFLDALETSFSPCNSTVSTSAETHWPPHESIPKSALKVCGCLCEST